MDLEEWTEKLMRHVKTMQEVEFVGLVDGEVGVFGVGLDDGTDFFVKVIEP